MPGYCLPLGHSQRITKTLLGACRAASQVGSAPEPCIPETPFCPRVPDTPAASLPPKTEPDAAEMQQPRINVDTTGEGEFSVCLTGITICRNL